MLVVIETTDGSTAATTPATSIAPVVLIAAGTASTGAAGRAAASSVARPATKPLAAPAATAARVNPAAAANRCGRRAAVGGIGRLGAAGAVGDAGGRGQGGEETPGARPGGGDRGGRRLHRGPQRRLRLRGAAGRTCVEPAPAPVRPPQEARENQARTPDARHTRRPWPPPRNTAFTGRAGRRGRASYDGGRHGSSGTEARRRARTRTGRGSPAAGASSPGPPEASAPRSPARSPAEGAAVGLLDVAGRRQGGRRRARRRRPRSPTSPTPTPRAPRWRASIDALGGIDVLVNNAGILRITPLLDITVDEWDSMFAVNARSMLVTTQVAARAMIAAGRRRQDRQHGEHGRQGRRRRPGALRRVEGGRRSRSPRPRRSSSAPHGITVNCDLPRLRAHRDGRRHAHARDGRRRGRRRRRSAAAPSRPTSPAMALFLASDDAAYCTGQAFNVTGGMIMH